MEDAQLLAPARLRLALREREGHLLLGLLSADRLLDLPDGSAFDVTCALPVAEGMPRAWRVRELGRAWAVGLLGARPRERATAEEAELWKRVAGLGAIEDVDVDLGDGRRACWRGDSERGRWHWSVTVLPERHGDAG